MADNTLTDAKKILKATRRILLVDWANPNIPKILIKKGFEVFCYSPDHYSRAEVVTEYPQNVNQKNIFPPANKEEGYLVFRPLDDGPASVDLVAMYRPVEEHAGIIINHVLPLRAKVLWLPSESAKTRPLAEEHGLILIEGKNIAEVAMLI